MSKAAVEKVEQKGPEKRRALGRGLESLLPGPRVVAVPSAGTQQIPQRGFAPVRNDSAVGDLQGVVESDGSDVSSSATTGPLLATEARSGAPGTVVEVGVPHFVRNDKGEVRNDNEEGKE